MGWWGESENKKEIAEAAGAAALAEDWPLEPAIDAFELIAGSLGDLSPRCSASFDGLFHPVHKSGAVYSW